MKPDEIGKKIVEKITEENEIVVLVAGVINATGQMLYWKIEENIDVGDYAIVENKNEYDLIKVVGLVYTTKANARKFSKTKYERMKKVIKLLQKENI